MSGRSKPDRGHKGLPYTRHNPNRRGGRGSHRSTPSGVSISERFMAARQGLGMLVFLALVSMYSASFYTTVTGNGNAASHIDGLALDIGNAGESNTSEEAKSVPTVTVKANKNTVRNLPGSIALDKSTFEGQEGTEVGKTQRNMLPGAINSDGPFDGAPNTPGGGTPKIEGAAAGREPNGTVVSSVTHSTVASTGASSSTVPETTTIAASSTTASSMSAGSNQSSTASSPATVGPVSSSGATSTHGSASDGVLRDGLGHPLKRRKAKRRKGKNASEEDDEEAAAAEAEKKKLQEEEDNEPVRRDGLGNIMPRRKKKKSKKTMRESSERETKADTKNSAGGELEEKSADSDSPDTEGKSENSETKKTKLSSTKSGESVGESSTGKTKSGEDMSSISMPPVDVGEHPMSRTMAELQVEGETGKLELPAVKKRYSKLVKAYLAPFKKGITRRAFFDILRRKNYSLAPPESNKGIQTILLQIIKSKVYLMDPYQVAKTSKAFYRTRIEEMIWLLGTVAKERKLADTEFLVAIHDCVQTVGKPHTYRGAHYMESSPTFSIVACNFSDNIPFPMWEGDEQRGGGLKGWDAKMQEYRKADTTPWDKKHGKAVFRGGNRPSMYFADKKDAGENCDHVGRSRLLHLSKEDSELYDVSIGGKCGSNTYVMNRMSGVEHHKYKYILYAEGNCFWADRLNKQIFGPSAILKQETPCGQFWEPLLRPMTHYIPTTFFFDDTTDQIKWGNEHDDDVQNIVKNANEFATNFLSLEGIKTYVEVLLTEYTKLLEKKSIEVEGGAVDVTAGKI